MRMSPSPGSTTSLKSNPARIAVVARCSRYSSADRLISGAPLGASSQGTQAELYHENAGLRPAATRTQAGYAPWECETATPERRITTSRVPSRHPAEAMISGGIFRHGIAEQGQAAWGGGYFTTASTCRLST